MRKALAALVPLVTCLVFVASASAHRVTTQEITCEGLTFSWADFPANQDNQFVLTWYYGASKVKVQTIDGWTDRYGSGTAGPIPLPSVPANGTHVAVTETWQADGGGMADVSQTLSCQPTVSNVSITCSGFHFTWTSEVPGPAINVVWQSPSGWGSTTVQESGNSGTTTVPLPHTPPNGTVVMGQATWAGGNTPTASSAPTTCIPVLPPPPPPPAPPTPPKPPAPPVPPPTPPTPPHHHHHHPHVVSVTLHLRYFNQDPQPVAMVSKAAPYGCRIVGPPASQLHGLVHFQVRCRSAKVLTGWKWYVDGRLVHNEHWTYTSDGGRRLNSWLFDSTVWSRPMIWGHYTITAKGKVRR